MVKGETKRMADKDKDQDQDQDQEQTKALEVKSGSDIQDAFVKLLSAMQASSHVPIPFTFVLERPSEAQKILLQTLNDRLIGRTPTPPTGICLTPISVAFPHCSDVLLAHVKIYETRATGPGSSAPFLKNEDDITKYFDDYFMFCDHRIIYRDERLRNLLDPALVGKISVTRGVETTDPGCLDKWFPPGVTQCLTENRPDIQQEPIIHSPTTSASSTKVCNDWSYSFLPLDRALWPPPHCLSPSCVTLSGKRHLYNIGATPPGRIRRLFMGDLVWLFYFERMGIFKILGVILDDIATQGKMPLSNGTVFQDVMDDVLAIITESMIRETKTGLSSTLRDRDSSYRRCLGWTSDVGRKLGLGTSVNNAFNTHFHRFIQQALEYYKDKRLASAIQGIPTGKPSVSTIITISDTSVLLKKAFDPFDYGRNYTNTLNGIVWVIAAMALIRELRTSLGIPEAYEQPYEYIPAAYDILVMKGPITSSQTNRYLVHRECANDARDILLDLEVINHTDTTPGGELELWLDTIEDKVEGYRTAYRSLTGIDLGIQQVSAAGAPLIEQQV